MTETQLSYFPISSTLRAFAIGIKLEENFFRQDDFLINSNSKKRFYHHEKYFSQRNFLKKFENYGKLPLDLINCQIHLEYMQYYFLIDQYVLY